MQMQNLPIVQSAKTPQRRFVTIAIVGALHIAAIYALIHALAPSLIEPAAPPVTHIDIFRTRQQPLPQHASQIPTTVRQTRDDVPDKPVITIDRSQEQGPIVEGPPVQQGGQSPAQVMPVFTPAHAIASTHTIPAYPLLSVRLNQQGNVRLSLTIDEQGFVTDAAVLTSSGYDTLDAAAVAWVKAHWRYQPATRDGHAVSAITNAIVTFRLTNRQG
jgi:protein TonB